MATLDMDKHYTIPQLLWAAAPSIVMMAFTSTYTIVDGLFISNFTGKVDFAAVNLIMPFIMVLSALGFMMGAGGTALVSKARGEGDDARANRWFSLITYFTFAAGICLAIIGALFMRPISLALGADESMIETCVLYGQLSMISLPFFMLQFMFQGFFPAAGKPKLGLAVMVAAGCTNIVLDFVLVGFLGMGVKGAVLATIVSEYLGGLIPLIYFFRKNSSYLKLGRCRMEWKTLGHACSNGLSEMVTEISVSVVSMLYNMQLMKYLGPDGVGAYGIIMYTVMVFTSCSIGYTMVSSPLTSYQYGANNLQELRSIWKKSLQVIGVSGPIMLIIAQLLIPVLATIYAGYDSHFYEITVHGFRIYALAFLLIGFGIYTSSLFTALGNGPVSALVSFLRTFVFECGAVLLLPLLFGPEGIWFAVVVAELIATIVSFALMLGFGKRYGYRKERPAS